MGEKANMQRINELLMTNSNWQGQVKKRYHKFINCYIENDCDLNSVARKFSFLLDDVTSIFSRIEKELEVNQWDNPNLFKDIKEEQRKELISVLSFLSKQKINKETFPPKLNQIIELTIQTKDLDYVSKTLNLRKYYVVERIVGRKEPRKPCEKGVLYYLKKPSNQKAS